MAGDSDKGLARVVATLRAACDAAAREGMSVIVERHVGSFADTPERIARLFEAVERASMCYEYPISRLRAVPRRLLIRT